MKTIVAVLHNIRSVHNVGSIFRTADAAGILKIYLTGITPSPLDRFGKFRADFTKVSLGAEKTIQWEYIKSTADVLKKIKKVGYFICAAEQSKNSIDYRKLKIGNKSKIALVLGNEVKGIPRSVLKLCDVTVEIPMRGKKESLNVSVAFGIIAYGVSGSV